MKRVIAIVVALILIMAPLSFAFADDDLTVPVMPPVEQMWKESGCYMLWILLQSYGILIGEDLSSIEPSDIVEWSDEVYNAVTDLVLQYLDSIPSPMSINYWISPWWWGSDFYGQFKYNSSMLEDAETFANWLMTKYNIGDNQTINTGTDYRLGPDNYVLYLVPATYDLTGMLSSMNGWYAIVTSGNSPVYIIWASTSTANMSPVMFSAEAFTYTYTQYNAQGAANYTETVSINTKRYTNWYCSLKPDGNFEHGIQACKKENNPFVYYTKSEIITALGGTVTQMGGYDVSTGVVVLPSDDPDYTEGDGVVIIDGEPDYQPVIITNEVTISNLPAVISPSGTQDPGFSQAFLPIKAFVNTFHDSMDIMRDIVYRLPSQVVTVFMFIFGVTAIFGALHMFKEH